jgi:ABC-type branched-subunit amino acid transport system permease subunit
MIAALRDSQAVKRFAACIAGSVVLAMMVGPQEGSSADYGYGFRKSVLNPRIAVFLLVGVLLFLAITYWPRLVPYLARPGLWPLFSGFLAVVAAQGLMHWYDQVGDKKFGSVASAVAGGSGISPVTTVFFAWLGWTQLVVLTAGGIAAIVLLRRSIAYAVAGLSVVAAVIVYLAHKGVVDAGNGVDHSLGYASAMLAAASSYTESSQVRDALSRAMGFRPGLPLAVVGLVLCLLSFFTATWFSPVDQNDTLADTHSLFSGRGLSAVADSYLAWLAYVLLAAALVVAGAATWLRHRLLGWAGAAIGVVGAVITLITLYDISKLAAQSQFDGADGPWQNLGAGGWMAAAGLFLIGAGGFVAATSRPGVDQAAKGPAAADEGLERRSVLSAPGAARSVALVAVAAALFYPPTATAFWQEVLVSQIGISMLLAVGLNVVVGWAGLLDLGFIAFYAIGSYTTAYLVGSLPVQPPEWLQMTPLLAIPFAVGICLLAGLALGAPTLRLRGDYLAIVTLGFGEIIHLAAVNAHGITNGSEGPPKAVPNPSIHIGPIHIQWGLAQLQYWYLLLVLLGVIVLAFRRLEDSRLGRAWAAVREDEVAAQATGINTPRVKLLAFAIGASTSGIAGVFFASQIGSFAPDNFLLNNSILIVAYVVFGGMGSLPGAMAGAALLTWLPEFLKDQVPPADRLMWIGAVVTLMMIFRSSGLLPARRRKAELSGLDGAARGEPVAVPAGEGM